VVCQTVVNSTIPELSNTYSELEISNDSDNESTDNIGLLLFFVQMLYLEDGMYSYGEMSFETHGSVPNMLGLQDPMISSTSGFLFFID
jgi:hypothetical protein